MQAGLTQVSAAAETCTPPQAGGGNYKAIHLLIDLGHFSPVTFHSSDFSRFQLLCELRAAAGRLQQLKHLLRAHLRTSMWRCRAVSANVSKFGRTCTFCTFVPQSSRCCSQFGTCCRDPDHQLHARSLGAAWHKTRANLRTAKRSLASSPSLEKRANDSAAVVPAGQVPTTGPFRRHPRPPSAAQPSPWRHWLCCWPCCWLRRPSALAVLRRQLQSARTASVSSPETFSRTPRSGAPSCATRPCRFMARSKTMGG